MTLRQFASGIETVPATTSWYLADLGEARGKQALFTRQSPQMLKVLREHALIESAISSNRIEGVVVDQKRIGTIVFGIMAVPFIDSGSVFDKVSLNLDKWKVAYGGGLRITWNQATVLKAGAVMISLREFSVSDLPPASGVRATTPSWVPRNSGVLETGSGHHRR